MQLHLIDSTIIILYLVSVVLVGFLMKRRAAKDINNYFLGGNLIPWYILGISNASGMFDITGTIWLVSIFFIYGLKSVWMPWMWPTFNQIFLMIFLAAWLRRSNVMTGAEWLKTRFGDGKDARLSHIIIVIFALINVVAFLAYGFKGIGKFSASFLPWEISENMYALIFMGITTLYVVEGGMYSVVITEVIQFVIMTIASIAIGIIAMNKVSPEMLNAVIPDGWKELFFGWTLNLDWSSIKASVGDLIVNAANTRIDQDGMSLFSIFFMLVLLKGLFLSMAGPAPNYDMQRVLATKNPKEAAKMSGFVSVALMFPRYMMIAGLTILALVFFRPDVATMPGGFDFEKILPFALKHYVPVGLLGIAMAGLLAAFMSTFAATVNAAPAYIVNDIYKKFINPNADKKTYIKMSYIASFGIVVVGVFFGFFVESIDSVTRWITGALYGGYTASNLLKWYWWRFNGYGYFWGMVAGIASTFILNFFIPNALYAFPFLFIISLIGCIVGSLATKATDENVLKDFYKKVRPWGFWKPIHKKVIEENPGFVNSSSWKRDSVNVVVGIVWQTTLVVTPIYLVIKEFGPMWIAVATLLVTSFFLKKNWYDKLED